MSAFVKEDILRRCGLAGCGSFYASLKVGIGIKFHRSIIQDRQFWSRSWAPPLGGHVISQRGAFRFCDAASPRLLRRSEFL